MLRNMTTEIDEKHRAMKEEAEKTLKASLPWNTGSPWSCTPPGTEAMVANATVVMSVATTEHACDALDSHFALSWASSLCVSVKISIAVWPL